MTERCRLYLISPADFALDSFEDSFAEAVAAGDVACFQLRMKDSADDEILSACERLMPIAHAADVAFILNDRPDLAAQAGADGVHIGQDDAPYQEARNVIGPERIVGVTCHNSRHLAMIAGEQGADYVAFGAFFPTSTKTVNFKASTDLLLWWSQLFEVPCVAIGGITTENCDSLIEAGADFLSVSAGVWSHPRGVKAAVHLFNEKMDAHHGKH